MPWVRVGPLYAIAKPPEAFVDAERVWVPVPAVPVLNVPKETEFEEIEKAIVGSTVAETVTTPFEIIGIAKVPVSPKSPEIVRVVVPTEPLVICLSPVVP